MHYSSFRPHVGSLFLVVLSFVLTANASPQKSIHLRMGTISPHEGLLPASASSNPRLAGLFLLQLTAPPTDTWRAELSALGVELLQYVPDDTFLVNVRNVAPGQLRQLDYVRWFGPYRSEHKIHPGVTREKDAAGTADVAVLLSRQATAAALQQMRGRFAQLRQAGRYSFGTVLRGRLRPAQLAALAASEDVWWIEPAADMQLLDELSSRIVAGDGPGNMTRMQSLGYTGAGVTVAVADSGLDSGNTNAMHPDIAGRVTALFHYGAPGQLEDAADEHSHGTHCAGIIAGNGLIGEKDEAGFLYGLGVAPGSQLIGQRIFDTEGGYAPPPSFEQLTRDAKRAGADIGSNSWGDNTQGRYDLSAMEFDALVRDADALASGDQPYILEFSAGNAGPSPRSLYSPAVAKNVIATGASQNDRFNLPLEEFAIYDEGRESMADFSSRGPCEDGRIKPDLVAPGTWIASLRSVYANDDYAWWPISGNYLYQGGTSQAGPQVSGAAAVFVQFYREHYSGSTPSPALVKAALINSAVDMDDGYSTSLVPNPDEGWGRLDLAALIGAERNHLFLDQAVLLTNSGVFEQRVLIGSAGEALRVTLTYTDVPGLPAAVIALVNDLDLEVLSPTGMLYRGNRFADGESIANALVTDTINNVETVQLIAPVPGEYTVRVRGTRVVQDARMDTVAVDQDFALVVSGAFGTPGVGIVTFDREAYRAPDQIRLVLLDNDLAGQSGGNVLVRSLTEPAGELVALLAHGSSGLFTGTVTTATGSAIADGRLQIAHGDLMEAVYADAAPQGNRVTSALADLQPPAITNVQGTNSLGQVFALWNTDEPARAEVYYGTNTLNQSLTNRSFQTQHEFALLNVPAGAVIQFLAVAEDAAGNRATNDNAGALFVVTNLQPPAVLLLDSYANFPLFNLTAPPLSGYTDALNQVGAVYNVFDARSGSLPTLAQLQSHRCVIWRADEMNAPPPALVQRLANFVNGGGSLLITSMEAVTRITEAGEPGFISNILQIQSYVEDMPVDEIAGMPGQNIGSGIDTPLDYSPYDDLLALLAVLGVTDPSDWITPTTNASAILSSEGQIVGVRSPRTGLDLLGRVVYLSFPLDAVPLGTGIGNNRAGLLRNILDFLAPPEGRSTITTDSDVYSVPGRALVEVEDEDMKDQAVLGITVRNATHTNEIALTLLETTRRGLFRGSVVFAPSATDAPGTLVVNAEDVVEFDYFDTSAALVRATAIIETNAPSLNDVFIEAGYLEAIVSWDTDEPTDALVQYSDSPNSFPINFVRYSPTMAMQHEIFLSGLQPDTKYYVRLISRDRAGNSTVDDNGGEFYTFTTLQPKLPPWFDDLETPSLEWSVVSAAESESEWTRDVPGGGENAYSGDNCWGSNLGGGPLGLMESYLISPGILLEGGNRATLRYQHNYDFFPYSDSEVQLAGVFIITNVATSPILLEQMDEDFSLGWEEMKFDLTPFMGNVVYIAWYHFLFSFEAPSRLGWLVDDVSITVDSVSFGTVRVTNNLWQAVFSLAGPTGGLGQGRWTVISNAPAGQYVVQFGDVPHYFTPASQTNTLSAGGTITFNGHYAFSDVNTNAISDSWELQHFGSVDPTRTAGTDSNRDGVSDYEKFIAGLDPNNPPPPFRLTAMGLTNGLVQLSWPSVTNHTYRVHGSTNAANWSAYSIILPATGTNTIFTLPAPTNGAPNLFCVEAAPPSGPNALAPFLWVTPNLLMSNIIRLDWPSSIGHGYRVLGSRNFSSWTPVSDWMRATNIASQLPITLTNEAGQFFTVEVQP